jgi:hypothetical protein
MFVVGVVCGYFFGLGGLRLSALCCGGVAVTAFEAGRKQTSRTLLARALNTADEE